jgi:uncharacterized protein (DUF58 family)
MVKEFELDPMADVWIFLDTFSDVHSELEEAEPEFDPRELWRKKFKFRIPAATIEYSVAAAASLARYYLEKRRAVGLVTEDIGLRVLPPERGGRQLIKILEQLAMVKTIGKMRIETLVEIQAKYITRGSSVVLITPENLDEVYQAAELLVRRGLRPIVILVDSSTFGGNSKSDKVMDKLRYSGIAFRVLQKGCDVSSVLSNRKFQDQFRY